MSWENSIAAVADDALDRQLAGYSTSLPARVLRMLGMHLSIAGAISVVVACLDAEFRQGLGIGAFAAFAGGMLLHCSHRIALLEDKVRPAL